MFRSILHKFFDDFGRSRRAFDVGKGRNASRNTIWPTIWICCAIKGKNRITFKSDGHAIRHVIKSSLTDVIHTTSPIKLLCCARAIEERRNSFWRWFFPSFSSSHAKEINLFPNNGTDAVKKRRWKKVLARRNEWWQLTCTSSPDWERRNCILGPRCLCKQFSLIRKTRFDKETQREFTQASSDWMIDTSCPGHCSPTAISSAASCTCLQSKSRLSYGHARWNICAKVCRRISKALQVCCFYPCTRNESLTSWLWSVTSSSIRCQFLWSSADTLHKCDVFWLIAEASSHDDVGDDFVEVFVVAADAAAVANVRSRRREILNERREEEKHVTLSFVDTFKTQSTHDRWNSIPSQASWLRMFTDMLKKVFLNV